MWTARLEGYYQTWTEGQRLLDIDLTLGQQEKATKVTVQIADPDGAIAADLIAHVQSQGGISSLPETKKPASGQTPLTGQGTFSTDLSPARKAFLDLVAWAEGADYDVMFGGKRFKDFSDHPDLTGEMVYGGRSNAAGRYQFLARDPKTWETAKAALGLPDFSPASQDKAAIWLISYQRGQGALDAVDRQDLDTALQETSYIWASLPPQRYPNQSVKAYADVKAKYDSLIAQYGSRPAEVAKVDPKAILKDLPGGQSQQQVVKGAKLIVSYRDLTWDFFHQGTSWDSNSSVLTLTGVGIRWVLNRRKRNKAVSDTTLKTLAQTIAQAHRVRLDWQAPYDVPYQYVRQDGISDYQLLLRECQEAGLWLSESGQTLTVKALSNIRDTAWVLQRGLNALSARFSDVAADAAKEDKGSSLAQSQPKTDIDALTGQILSTRKDIDPVKSKDVTGTASEKPKGLVQPGTESILSQAKGRYKRVQGLPSQLEIPLTAQSLTIVPLDAIRTKGFPGLLSRVWLVSEVGHSVAKGVTTLSVYSPVEVLDLTAQGPTGPIQASTGRHIWPVSGFPVTSLVGPRDIGVGSKNHKGTDIGCPTGTPVKASDSGTVITVAYQASGAGKYIVIRHTDGLETTYMHLSAQQVQEGAQVSQGQIIGLSGATGIGSGPHIHWQINKGEEVLTPGKVGLVEPAIGFVTP